MVDVVPETDGSLTPLLTGLSFLTKEVLEKVRLLSLCRKTIPGAWSVILKN